MNLNLTWVELPKLTEHLCCSTRIVYELKRAGVLKAGKHFYACGTETLKGKHIYCIELCRQALLENTAELAKQKSKKIRSQETYNESHLKELVASTFKES